MKSFDDIKKESIEFLRRNPQIYIGDSQLMEDLVYRDYKPKEGCPDALAYFLEGLKLENVSLIGIDFGRGKSDTVECEVEYGKD